MADGVVVVQPDSTGKKIDTSEITVGANTVERQRIVIADPSTAAALGIVMNSQPAGTEYGLVIREAQKGQTTMASSRPVVIASDNILTVQGSQPARTSGTITTATSVVGPLNVDNLNVVTVTIHGTYAGVTVIFEASDDSGTTWYTVQGQRSDTGFIQSTDTPPSSTTRSWDVAVGGFNQFRVRATAWTSGTATIGLSPQTFAYDPTPSVRNMLDGNRTYLTFYMDRVTPSSSGAETLGSFSVNKAETVTNSQTSYTVTAGKTLRLQSFAVSLLNSSSTSSNGRIRVRSAASTPTTSSPIIASVDLGNFTGTAAAGVGQSEVVCIPDCIEIAGGHMVAITYNVNTTSSTISTMLIGYEY